MAFFDEFIGCPVRSIFVLAALVLLLATTTGCPEAAAQADLTGKWLRFDSSICHTTITEGAKAEREECSESPLAIGVTKSGHLWLGIECPRNSTTPPNREHSKDDSFEETIVGRVTCSTEGSQTTLKWAGMVKDIYSRTSLTKIMKTETILSFETDAKGCRLLSYTRMIHAVRSDSVDPNGERRPGSITEYKSRLGKALKCQILDSEKEARAIEFKFK
jgi:hypothetical protein